MTRIVTVAALAAFFSFGGAVAVQASDGSPDAGVYFAQMNSPGDGISSGAASSGNGRWRRGKYKYGARYHRGLPAHRRRHH